MAHGRLSRHKGVKTEPPYDNGPARALIAKHEALGYPFECQFGRSRLVVDKGVFCPTLTNASPLLLEAIDFRPHERVLDVFAGTGAFGINAALSGADHVVTVDIASAAVASTLKNKELNGVADQLDERIGTMRTCLGADEQFDLVIANPPLLPGQPQDDLAAAIYDPGMAATLEFIQELPEHLAPQGRGYLLTSSIFAQLGHDVDRLCRAIGLTSAVVLSSDLGYERYRVHKITW